MGDDIELRAIKIIQGGLFQIDFYNKTKNKGYRVFIDPAKLMQMITDALPKDALQMKSEGSIQITNEDSVKTLLTVVGTILQEKHDAHVAQWAKDNGMEPCTCADKSNCDGSCAHDPTGGAYE